MERFFIELSNMRLQLAEGLITTVEVSIAAIITGTALGLFVGVGLAFGTRPVRWPLRAYVDVVRGTPVLVLILAAFYILAAFGIHFTATGSGVFALSLFCGAHLGEIFRGALEAIPLTQIEAGKSMGLKMRQILLLVLLPQALRQALPVWINTAVEIVKASTLLSIIGVGELLLKTQEIIGRTFLTLDFYIFAGLIYFLINFSIEQVGRIAERRLAGH
ncbi:MAG: amino acid ABC transporter permease [Mesorhizobium sp.]|jgi:polar amino acid transport system permease protein